MLQLITLFSLALALVQGLVIPELTTSDGTLPLQLDFKILKTVGDISAKEFWANNAAERAKRDAYSEVIAPYRDVSYHIDVYLGSNGQKSTVLLDTGSSDLWVPNNNYDPTTSTSSKDINQQFAIAYVSGQGANGKYYQDTLRFETANPVVPNFQFARAGASGGFGTLGIADIDLETASTKYDNLPWAMQKAGLISKASYSLFLGQRGQSGSLILGGIDTAKYQGELVQYPLAKWGSGLGLNLASIGINGTDIPVNQNILLDSGTTLGLLNLALMKQMDAIFNPTIKAYGPVQYRIINCNQPSDKFINLNFGKNSISMSYADAVYHAGGNTCFLAFGWYNDVMILGDIFLRKAYVYYDLSDRTISIAQASYSSSSNVISA